MYNGEVSLLGRLFDRPYRAGPPTPTQSSAMVSSPAAPTAGLCFSRHRSGGLWTNLIPRARLQLCDQIGEPTTCSFELLPGHIGEWELAAQDDA